jgi:hypothetical protein
VASGKLAREVSQLPNGHSGGFVIKKLDLSRFLDEMAPTTVIGVRYGQPTTVADLLDALADEHQNSRWFAPSLAPDKIYISQNDLSWYAIHLGSARDWIMILKDSPLADPFRDALRVSRRVGVRRSR